MKSRKKITTGYQVPCGNFQKRLLRWYDQNCRPLPWRSKRPSPYRVWLSEIMLQQTQVETVLPYFRRFLKTFPTVQKLAGAPMEEVVRLWSGLGYYSRARNLHHAAQLIVARGGFPQTKAEWIKLPGIGEYTAGAIASIAFGECVPVVDGNVIRVLTRVFALPGDPKQNPLKAKLWHLAAGLVLAPRPGDFNQALMELGALVCLPKEPKCGVCPFNKICLATLSEKIAAYPTLQPKQPMRKVMLKAYLIIKNGRLLLAKRNGARHLQSMWEFPQVKPTPLELELQSPKALPHHPSHCRRQLAQRAKGRVVGLPVVRHSIMNRRIRLQPSLWKFVGGKLKSNHHYVAYRWIKPEELKNFPTSSLNQKILKIFQHQKT